MSQDHFQLRLLVHFSANKIWLLQLNASEVSLAGTLEHVLISEGKKILFFSVSIIDSSSLNILAFNGALCSFCVVPEAHPWIMLADSIYKLLLAEETEALCEAPENVHTVTSFGLSWKSNPSPSQRIPPRITKSITLLKQIVHRLL